MLFAESTPQSAELGVWLAGFAAVAGVIVLVLHGLHLYRQLTASPPEPPAPPVPEADQTIRRAEWVAKLESVESQIESIGERQITLEKYTHEAVHGLRDSLHQLRIALETMRLQIHQSIVQMVERLENRMGRNTTAVTRILTMLEGRARGERHDDPQEEEEK